MKGIYANLFNKVLSYDVHIVQEERKEMQAAVCF